MKLGRWLILGREADDTYRLARQCANVMAKVQRRQETIRRLERALAEANHHLREAVEDKEQLKGILKAIAPERLQDWKQSRRSEQESGTCEAGQK